jgi:hypothetical protein
LPLTALGVAVLFASGCIPVKRFHPLDGRGQKIERWTQVIDGVRFEMTGCTISSAGRSTQGTLLVGNDSDREVVVLGGRLVTVNGREWKSQLPVNQAGKDYTVAAGQSLSAVFVFGGDEGDSPYDEVGANIFWVWRVRVGAEEHVLQVPMKQG